MPKLTNNAASARILPIKQGAVEIAPGGSYEMSGENWDAIKDRDSIKADIEANFLTVDDTLAAEAEGEPVPVAPPPAKAPAKPKKAKA